MTLVLDPVEVPVVEPVSMPKPLTIADTLYRAADLMEKGWMTNWLFDLQQTGGLLINATRFCAIGALMRVTLPDDKCYTTHPNISPSADAAVRYVSKYLELTPRTNWIRSGVALWNNCNTQEIVVDTFRKVADKAVLEGV